MGAGLSGCGLCINCGHHVKIETRHVTPYIPENKTETSLDMRHNIISMLSQEWVFNTVSFNFNLFSGTQIDTQNIHEKINSFEL